MAAADGELTPQRRINLRCGAVTTQPHAGARARGDGLLHLPECTWLRQRRGMGHRPHDDLRAAAEPAVPSTGARRRSRSAHLPRWTSTSDDKRLPPMRAGRCGTCAMATGPTQRSGWCTRVGGATATATAMAGAMEGCDGSRLQKHPLVRHRAAALSCCPTQCNAAMEPRPCRRRLEYECGTSKRRARGLMPAVSQWSLPFGAGCLHLHPHGFVAPMSSTLPCRPRVSTLSCSMASDCPLAKPLVDRVVIVGGGLGGLAAAIQLRHVGIDAQVYERGGKLTGGEGTLLSLFPNGCKSLNQADPSLVTKVRAAGRADAPALMINPISGELLGSWELSERMEKTYGQPVIAILWRNLLRILSDTLPDECKHFGYECLDVSQDEEGATVHFKKDDETVSVKAPLVIGADGIRSVVRSKTFGAMPPRDNGRTMWRAVLDANLCHHPALRMGTITAAQKGKTMFVINGVGDKLYWAYSLTDEATDGRAKMRSKDLEDAKARLRQEFQGWDLALHILEATDPDLILERRVLDLPVLTKWTDGRVAVLGDAAHAVTPALGQGANLAFEDGLELAIQLTSASDLRSALKTYEERRIPRAKIVSARTRATGVAHPQSFYDWLYNETPSSSHDPVPYEYQT